MVLDCPPPFSRLLRRSIGYLRRLTLEMFVDKLISTKMSNGGRPLTPAGQGLPSIRIPIRARSKVYTKCHNLRSTSETLNIDNVREPDVLAQNVYQGCSCHIIRHRVRCKSTAYERFSSRMALKSTP